MDLIEQIYKRQGLYPKVKEKAYDALFRRMSPVPTLSWIEPGSAPQILHRCEFNDYEANDFSRRTRDIIKGRFQGGRVAYIFYEELPLFKAAYEKPIKEFTEHESIVLNILEYEGPMNIKLIKEISGLLSKEISKALQRLQKAFIVFEDQVDMDNDRAWYLLKNELNDLDFSTYTRESARIEIVKRFIYLNVVVDTSMIKSYTGFTNKDIQQILQSMSDQKLIVPTKYYEIEGYALKEEVLSLVEVKDTVPDTIYIMDLNDYLVKSHELMLKKCFGASQYKTLQYIYYKGFFIGRVLGFFRFGPNDVENIELLAFKNDCLPNGCNLPEAERTIMACNDYYRREGSQLKRFKGKEI